VRRSKIAYLSATLLPFEHVKL